VAASRTACQILHSILPTKSIRNRFKFHVPIECAQISSEGDTSNNTLTETARLVDDDDVTVPLTNQHVGPGQQLAGGGSAAGVEGRGQVSDFVGGQCVVEHRQLGQFSDETLLRVESSTDCILLLT